MIEEELRKYVGGKYSSRELRIAANFYKRGLTCNQPTVDETIDAFRMEYEKGRADAFKRAAEAFCKATCNGEPPQSTCTSLGTCKKYDNFVKFIKG